MKLNDYVSGRGAKQQLARSLGVHPQCIWDWTSDRQIPEHYCFLIEIATDGQVTAEECRPDLAVKFAQIRGWVRGRSSAGAQVEAR